MDSIRNEFPICRQKFSIMGGEENSPLIYLDHGASTHPPERVIQAHKNFLEKFYANIHRGNHNMSLIATDMFDRVEYVILDFINSEPEDNIAVLTNNTTGGLDLAAYVMSQFDGITLSTIIEHHSNILPHKRRGETVLVKSLEDGTLDMDDLEAKLEENKVKLVAITGASNVTGFMPDIHKIARLAHENRAKILVDAAQLLAHHKIDVKPDNDPEHIDFLAGAGHKAYAPFGSAFLYGPRKLFDSISPYIPGGGTIDFVTAEEEIWTRSPDRHQGGTPNIAGAIAMAESLKFLKEIGLDRIREHERGLYEFAIKGLERIDGVTVYGPKDPDRCIGVISFNVRGVPDVLVSAILNYEAAIATRNGCFCAHPYVQHLLGIQEPMRCWYMFKNREINFMPGAVRATIGIYNTKSEIQAFLNMVEIIAQQRWQGEYEISNVKLCRPTQFAPKGVASGMASCLLDPNAPVCPGIKV